MNIPYAECLGCGDLWEWGEAPESCCCMDSVWRIHTFTGTYDYDENEMVPVDE